MDIRTALQDRQALAAALRGPVDIERVAVSDDEMRDIGGAVDRWRARNNIAADAFAELRKVSDEELRRDMAAVPPPDGEGWGLDVAGATWARAVRVTG